MKVKPAFFLLLIISIMFTGCNNDYAPENENGTENIQSEETPFARLNKINIDGIVFSLPVSKGELEKNFVLGNMGSGMYKLYLNDVARGTVVCYSDTDTVCSFSPEISEVFKNDKEENVIYYYDADFKIGGIDGNITEEGMQELLGPPSKSYPGEKESSYVYNYDEGVLIMSFSENKVYNVILALSAKNEGEDNTGKEQ